MNFGLNKTELTCLHEKLVTPLKDLGATVYIFGSRARGTQQKYSDIDILVDATVNLSRIISAIAEEFSASNFPYKIDIVEDRFLADSYRPSIYAERIQL